MLQQTQVSRVIPKYQLFLQKFPTSKALAKATPAEVLKVWSGLGYNRRGLYLRRAAHMVMANYKGRLPRTIEALTELPGVGINTAGAIAAYAYNYPTVFIETNIRRTFLHHFFPGKKNIADNQLRSIIEKSLDVKNPKEWYWALMDYGSYLATQGSNPNRRSKHYAKQSKFEGSRRQLRGKIIRLLLEKPLSVKELITELGVELSGVVSSLEKEGFAIRKNSKLQISNSSAKGGSAFGGK